LRKLPLALLILILLAAPSWSQTQHSITLTWTANAGDVNFVVQRAVSASGPWTTLATLTPVAPATVAVTTYVDTTGVAGTAYFYQVFATDANTPPDDSGDSNVIGPLTFLGNPAAPTGLAGVVK
jgi:cellulose 1,4-beta-cellobiosidase